MFAASTIRRAIELKALHLQCMKAFHSVDINEIHGMFHSNNTGIAYTRIL